MTTLLDIKRELMLLESQETRDELLLMELDPVVDAINKLESVCLDIEISQFRTSVRSIEQDLEALGAGRKHSLLTQAYNRVRKLLTKRQDHDRTIAIQQESLELSMRALEHSSRSFSKAALKKKSTISGMEEPVLPPELQLLKDLCGIKFIFIASGTYSIGPERSPYDLEEGIWISQDLITTKHCVCASRIPTRLSVTPIPPQVLSFNSVNHVPRGLLESGDQGYEIVDGKNNSHAGVNLNEPLELPFYFANRFAREVGCTIPSWQHWECATRGPNGYAYPWASNIMDEDHIYIDEKTKEITSFGKYSVLPSQPFGLMGVCSHRPEWNTAQCDLGLPTKGVHHSPFRSDPPASHCLRKITSRSDLTTTHWPFWEERCATFRLCFAVTRPPVPVSRESLFLNRFPATSSALLEAMSNTLKKDEMNVFQIMGRAEYEDTSKGLLAWPSRGVSCFVDAARDIRAVQFHNGYCVLAPSRVEYETYKGPLYESGETVPFDGAPTTFGFFEGWTAHAFSKASKGKLDPIHEDVVEIAVKGKVFQKRSFVWFDGMVMAMILSAE
eukprot:PhF_6_TR30118/c0_g1_i2/m.44000